jgi:hypothetical protein
MRVMTCLLLNAKWNWSDFRRVIPLKTHVDINAEIRVVMAPSLPTMAPAMLDWRIIRSFGLHRERDRIS